MCLCLFSDSTVVSPVPSVVWNGRTHLAYARPFIMWTTLFFAYCLPHLFQATSGHTGTDRAHERKQELESYESNDDAGKRTMWLRSLDHLSCLCVGRVVGRRWHWCETVHICYVVPPHIGLLKTCVGAYIVDRLLGSILTNGSGSSADAFCSYTGFSLDVEGFVNIIHVIFQSNGCTLQLCIHCPLSNRRPNFNRTVDYAGCQHRLVHIDSAAIRHLWLGSDDVWWMNPNGKIICIRFLEKNMFFLIFN